MLFTLSLKPQVRCFDQLSQLKFCKFMDNCRHCRLPDIILSKVLEVTLKFNKKWLLQ